MSLIQLENVSRIYHQGDAIVKAVDQVTTSFAEGEFTALTGPSGSGKTTLLNLIGVLDTPDEGTICYKGEEVQSLGTKEASHFRLENIGFIFQAYNLIPVLTARENIEYVLTLRKVPAEERQERSQRLLKHMEMEDLGHRFPRELSGGQQQRVAVARALVADPEVVLADEPTANLDSKNATLLLEMMQRLSTEEKTTFLFSTHDPRVLSYARRTLTLEDGRIVKDVAGAPALGK